MDFHAVEHLALQRAAPAGRHERDSVTPPRQTAERFVKMHLGATRPRVSSIQPVEHEDGEQDRDAVSGVDVQPPRAKCRLRSEMAAQRRHGAMR